MAGTAERQVQFGQVGFQELACLLRCGVNGSQIGWWLRGAQAAYAFALGECVEAFKEPPVLQKLDNTSLL